MTAKTLGALASQHSAELLDYHDLDLEIPVLSGMQFQGDVAIIPARMLKEATSGQIVPADGIAVVRGENGRNTHLLVADGPVLWEAAPPSQGPADLALGTVTVPAGCTAWLTHPEHGFNGIGPGVYEIRRQREQAEEIRLIAD